MTLSVSTVAVNFPLACVTFVLEAAGAAVVELDVVLSANTAGANAPVCSAAVTYKTSVFS